MFDSRFTEGRANAEGLFTCRYPESLADQSFDNTGCQSFYEDSLFAYHANLKQYSWKHHLIPYDGR